MIFPLGQSQVLRQSLVSLPFVSSLALSGSLKGLAGHPRHTDRQFPQGFDYLSACGCHGSMYFSVFPPHPLFFCEEGEGEKLVSGCLLTLKTKRPLSI
jgi:hypothetical protein